MLNLHHPSTVTILLFAWFSFDTGCWASPVPMDPQHHPSCNLFHSPCREDDPSSSSLGLDNFDVNQFFNWEDVESTAETGSHAGHQKLPLNSEAGSEHGHWTTSPGYSNALHVPSMSYTPTRSLSSPNSVRLLGKDARSEGEASMSMPVPSGISDPTSSHDPPSPIPLPYSSSPSQRDQGPPSSQATTVTQGSANKLTPKPRRRSTAKDRLSAAWKILSFADKRKITSLLRPTLQRGSKRAGTTRDRAGAIMTAHLAQLLTSSDEKQVSKGIALADKLSKERSRARVRPWMENLLEQERPQVVKKLAKAVGLSNPHIYSVMGCKNYTSSQAQRILKADEEEMKEIAKEYRRETIIGNQRKKNKTKYIER